MRCFLKNTNLEEKTSFCKESRLQGGLVCFDMFLVDERTTEIRAAPSPGSESLILD